MLTGIGTGVSFSRNFGTGITPPTNPMAQAYIDALGITDPAVKTALIDFCNALDTAGLTPLINVLYPFIGYWADPFYTPEYANSLNLINIATYQITWNDSINIVFNQNGVRFDGINTFGDTGYNESSVETFGNCHRAIYDRSSDIDNGIQIGASGAGGVTQINSIATSTGTGEYIVNCYGEDNDVNSLTGSNVSGSQGFWISSKLSLNPAGLNVYKNLDSLNNTHSDDVGSTQPNVSTYIGGLNNNGSLSSPTSHNLALVSMGAGLDAAQALDYYIAVQAFQTILGRKAV